VLLVAEIMKLIVSIVLESLTFNKNMDKDRTMDVMDMEGVNQNEIRAKTTRTSTNNTSGHCLLSRRMWDNFMISFRIHILDNPKDALKLIIPSGLYLLQNSIVYYSISLVPVPLFQVMQQTKLVTTAVLSTLFLKRSYDCTQWCSIISLCIGATICILSSTSDSDKDVDSHMNVKEEISTTPQSLTSAGSFFFGLILIVISNLSSSIAGVYFETVIKGTDEANDGSRKNKIKPSIWMRNLQLAFFTVCIISAKSIVSYNSEDKTPFFYGFTPLLWVQICIFSFGGLLVASVIKYTDTVQKGLATGLSVVTSSLLSMQIEKSEKSMSLVDFIFGSVFAIAGCFFFANPNAIKRICMPTITFRGGFGSIMKAFIFLLFVFQYNNTSELQKQLLKTMKNNSTQYLNGNNNNNDITGVQYSNIPDDWKDRLHMHLTTHSDRGYDGCGGCMVLWELLDSLVDLGISTSEKQIKFRPHCPSEEDLAAPIAANKTIVFVYPEVDGHTCEAPFIPKSNVVHVRWIMAPLTSSDKNAFLKWGKDDLVFNYASSCALRPDLLPSSNILQVITSPKEGDQYDLPEEIFYKVDRQGTAWTRRKGHKFHSSIDYFLSMVKTLPGPIIELGIDVHGVAKDFTVDNLQKYEYFVSYDPYTYYTYTAAMSGVVSIVHPIANMTKEDWAFGTYVGEYLKAHGGSVPGIAYGFSNEEIEYARSTMSELRGFMMKVRKWGKETTVERFARDCYRYGDGERKFESGLLVYDAYSKFYSKEGRLLPNVTYMLEQDTNL